MGTKYEVEVVIELELDLDDVDGEDEAFRAVDVLMQRAWDNDRRLGDLGDGPKWDYTMLEGAASRVEDHLYELPSLDDAGSESVVLSSGTDNDTTTEGP